MLAEHWLIYLRAVSKPPRARAAMRRVLAAQIARDRFGCKTVHEIKGHKIKPFLETVKRLK